MSNLKGTKTEANLMTAFAGESMARNKYTYYAAKAKEEGYEQIANIFLETARNEMEHAKLWYKLLHDGQVADTMTNLKMQLLVKMVNGQICMLVLLRKLARKDLTVSLYYLKWLEKLRSIMKNAI